jgi:hypothetical protein
MSLTRRHFLALTGGAAIAWEHILVGAPEQSPNYKMNGPLVGYAHRRH